MTTDAYQEIRRRALERIDGAGIDPTDDSGPLIKLLEETVDDYQRMAHLGEGRSLANPEATVQTALSVRVGTWAARRSARP